MNYKDEKSRSIKVGSITLKHIKVLCGEANISKLIIIVAKHLWKGQTSCNLEMVIYFVLV